MKISLWNYIKNKIDKSTNRINHSIYKRNATLISYYKPIKPFYEVVTNRIGSILVSNMLMMERERG